MTQTAPLCAHCQPIPHSDDFGVDLNLGKETQRLPEEIAPAGLLAWLL